MTQMRAFIRIRPYGHSGCENVKRGIRQWQAAAAAAAAPAFHARTVSSLAHHLQHQ